MDGNNGENIRVSTASNLGAEISSRNAYGVNLLSGSKPFKRRVSADVVADVTKNKRARLDGLLKEMTQKSNVMKRFLKPSENGSSSTFTETPTYIENGKLRSYQVAGLNWMIALYEYGLSGILGDEMGLGKTLQSISLIGYLQLVRKVDGRFLVVVPLSTLTNWEHEFEHWCPSLNVISIHGSDNVRQQIINTMLNVEPFDWDVCLTTYETCKQKYSRRFFSTMRWHHIILDEGTRIKNEDTDLAQVVRHFKATYRLILTGTPLNNNLHELWALLSFLMPTEFESPIEFDVWFDDNACLGNQNTSVVENLHTILRPLLLRRLKHEVENIKPYKDINVYVNLTNLQREWYRKVLTKNIEIVQGNGDIKFAVLNSMFMQLRKCTNHPYLFDGAESGPPFLNGDHIVRNSGKMIVLDKLLAKLKEQKSRVLVFSQFTRVLDIIEDYLCLHPEYEYCRIDGQVNIIDRTSRIAEFQDEQSKKFVFLLSTRAGGLGINLTAADAVILYDLDWNPQMDLQAIARVHRIGQTKKVRVFRLIAKDTVDEKMIERADMKLLLSDVVIGSQVKSRSVVPTDFLLSAVRYGTDAILSNDSSYDGAERDKLIQENSQKLVDQIFEE